MTGVVAWKVYREQRQVWLVMAGLAVGAVVLRQTGLAPELNPQALTRMFCLFAYIYGLVVGAVLLAGEREGGTVPFLEGLPATRVAVWRVKCIAGVALVLAQALFLWGVLLGHGVVPDLENRMLLGILVVLATLGFAWGLFFSGWTQTSLGAIFAAIVGQAVLAPVLLGLLSLFLFVLQATPGSKMEGLCLLFLGLVQVAGLILASGVKQFWRDEGRETDWSPFRELAPWSSSEGGLVLPRRPLASAAWSSAWPEPADAEQMPSLARLRRARQGPRSPAKSEQADNSNDPAWRSELKALIWLDLRQAGPLFIGLALAALIAGILPLWVLGWPVLTLVLGVIAGVSVFAGEMAEGTGRFLAEQRLPLGKIWTVKVGVRLALALGIVHLLLLPAGVVAAVRSLEGTASTGLPPTEIAGLAPYLQMGPYLTLGLGHGFCLGCLFGLLFRKAVIAGAVALAAALLLLTLWVPSLVVGGLHWWQYWGLPILVLLTTRLQVWPWAAGLLASRRAVLRLTLGLILAALWFAGAIAYRVLEVPAVEDKLDLPGFHKQLELARKNETGLLVRGLLNQAGRLGRKAGAAIAEEDILRKGWPAEARGELSSSLNDLFEQPWARQLAEAPRWRLGVVQDVTSMLPGTGPGTIEQAQVLAQLLVARGLQQQGEGNPAAFVEHLAAGLALVRQVRHLQPTTVAWFGRLAELDLMRGVERWLERLDGRPELLRRVLILLREHEEARGQEAEDGWRADYLVAVNAIQRPESWAAGLVRDRHGDGDLLAGLLASAWRTPWEEARLQRLVCQLANEGNTAVRLPPPLTRDNLFPRDNHRIRIGDPQETTHIVVRELMVALRLYQVEMGRPARRLEELVPGVLASVPLARGTGEPFEYQLLDGKGLPAQGSLSFRGERFLVPLPPGR